MLSNIHIEDNIIHHLVIINALNNIFSKDNITNNISAFNEPCIPWEN